MAKQMPDGYLNATIGLTVTTIVDNKEVTETITGVISMIDNIPSIKFEKLSEIEKINNTIKIISITINGVEVIKKNEEIEEENNGQ
jgi:hypothetical protein